MDLDSLDAEVAGPMLVGHLGEVVTLPPATDFSWREVVGAAVDMRVFSAFVWPLQRRIRYCDLVLVREAWLRHNGLPMGDQCRRLAYMMEKYAAGVEYDLRHHLGVSAGELWRTRRWRELLNYIDLLPTNTHMNRLLTTDEEYMEAVMARRKDTKEGPVRPSMAEFSLTNSLLMQLIDAVHVNTAVNRGIANPNKSMPHIDPTPRPYTAMEKVRHRIEQKKHNEMVAMLLPHKAKDEVA